VYESTQWAFGAILVVLYAADRFNAGRFWIPRPMRATTTFWRYWSAWCGYIVAMTGLFMFLGGAFTAIEPKTILAFLGIENISIDEGTLPGPLLSALMLTSLLPHAPVLGKIDNSVKEWFRRVGNIPFEVRELSARLIAATYDPPTPVLDALRPTLATFGVDAAWLRDSPSTIRQPWAQVVTLFAQVQRWEGARGYTHYFDDNKTVLIELRAKLESMAEMLQPVVLAELDAGHDSPFVARIRRRIASELGDLRKTLCDLVSGGVLSEGRNYSQRLAALTRLGFTGLPALRAPLSANDIVLVMGLVFLAVVFIPLMARRFFEPTPLEAQIRLFILIPVIYAIAVVAAIYPKSAWRFARRDVGGGRPVAAYAASAVLAVAAAFVVSLLLRFAFDANGNVFQALATPDAFARAWTKSLERWPWHFMTFFMTVAIAWMADDWLRQSAEPGWLRWVEAVVMCAICAALQWTVVQLFLAAGSETTATLEMLAALQERLPVTLATAAAIGAAIGWFVPHTYRSRGRQTSAVAVSAAVPVSG